MAALSPSIVQRNNDFELATLLAVQAESLYREVGGPIQGLIDSSLHDILSAPYFHTVLSGHQDRVNSVAFSSDGNRLASGSVDDTIRLWDLTEPGAEPVLLSGHQDFVETVTFSPDGNTLDSGSLDNTIRLWDLIEPGAEPVVLSGHQSRVNSVAFSPDGNTLDSGSADGTIRLWLPWIDSLVDIACQQVRRNMTRTEWDQFMGDEPYRATCPNLPIEGE